MLQDRTNKRFLYSITQLDTSQFCNSTSFEFIIVLYILFVMFTAGLTIQSETHDSTEDAKTALQLYRKYEELSSKGEFRKVLKQLYEDGRKSGWKVEEKDY